MLKNTRCPKCGRRRKASHEKKINQTSCVKYKPLNILSTTWPFKTHTGPISVLDRIRPKKGKYKRSRSPFAACYN